MTLENSQQAVAQTSVDRDRIVQQVRRWGGLASEAVLDPVCHVFSMPNIDGLIGYRHEKNCIVAFGDPICPPEDMPTLVKGFQDFSKEKNSNTVFIMASKPFKDWALNNSAHVAMEYGHEAYVDPFNDPRDWEGNRGSLVRRKVRHAEKEGTVVKEYLGKDLDLEQAIENVGKAWLGNRQGRQVFISHVRLFEDRNGKRWFYAKKGNKVVGVAMLNQIQSRKGWLLNRLMFTPDAPNGTPEIIVVSILEMLRKERCHYVTSGSVPNGTIDEITGMNPVTSWITKQAFKVVNKVFHLDGKKTFWDKFHPESEKSYLVFNEPNVGVREMLALARALNMT